MQTGKHISKETGAWHSCLFCIGLMALCSVFLGDNWYSSTLSLRAMTDTQEMQKQAINFIVWPCPASGNPSYGSLHSFISPACRFWDTVSVILAWRTVLVWYTLIQLTLGCVPREHQVDWAHRAMAKIRVAHRCGSASGLAVVAVWPWHGHPLG